MAATAFPLVSNQTGRETVFGVLPSNGANLTWPTLNVAMEMAAATNTYDPQGSLVYGGTVLGQETTTGTIAESPFDYTEAAYLFNNAFITATPVQIGSTAAYTQTYNVPYNASRAAESWAWQYGDPGQVGTGYQALGTKVNALTLNFSRQKATVSGTLLGQRSTTLVTETTTPVAIAKRSVVPGNVGVKLADTAAGLGAASTLTYGFSVTVAFSTIWVPVWSLDPSFPSYREVVPGKMTPKLTLMLGADATSIGGSTSLLNTLRNGARKFIRITASGPNIAATSTPYSAVLDFAIEPTTDGKAGNENGVYAHTWEFAIVEDGTWGQWMNIVLTNALTAFA
jgi:hypothetical protein